MEIAPVENHTVAGYLETISNNIGALSKNLNNEIAGCMWQGSSMDLQRQVELNETLVSLQKQMLQMEQTSKDLVAVFGQSNPKQ